MGTCAQLNFFEDTLQPNNAPLGAILDLLNAPPLARLPGAKTDRRDLRRHLSVRMNKQTTQHRARSSRWSPSPASCVGLLLYLWISFGGTVPLAAQGYRFSVEFDQAVELGAQAAGARSPASRWDGW